MKVFLDTGDVAAVRRAHETGLLDGVTTNPRHIARAGRRFRDVVKEICDVVSGPVSVEVMAEDADGMVAEAVEIAALAPNVAVKIPMTVEGMKAVPVLEQDKQISLDSFVLPKEEGEVDWQFLQGGSGSPFTALPFSRQLRQDCPLLHLHQVSQALYIVSLLDGVVHLGQ